MRRQAVDQFHKVLAIAGGENKRLDKIFWWTVRCCCTISSNFVTISTLKRKSVAFGLLALFNRPVTQECGINYYFRDEKYTFRDRKGTYFGLTLCYIYISSNPNSLLLFLVLGIVWWPWKILICQLWQ